MNWLLRLFGRKPRFEPHVFDVHQYEAELLFQRDLGIELRPPPSLLSGWQLTDENYSCAERTAMEQNRRLLQEVYWRVKNRT